MINKKLNEFNIFHDYKNILFLDESNILARNIEGITQNKFMSL